MPWESSDMSLINEEPVPQYDEAVSHLVDRQIDQQQSNQRAGLI